MTQRNGRVLSEEERDLVRTFQLRGAAAAGPVASTSGPSAPVPDIQAKPQSRLRKGFGKAVNAVSLSGDLGSLMLSWGLRNAGIGSEEDQGRLSQSIKETWRSGSGLSRLSQLQAVNRERSSLWWGEKLMTSVVADPLTYVGFGFLGKAPLAGKLLGPMEQAYIRATNEAVGGVVKGVTWGVGLPFRRGAGRVTTQVPEAVAQRVRDIAPMSFKTQRIYDDAFNIFKTGFEDSVESGTILTRQSEGDTTKFLLEDVLAATPEQLKAFPDRKRVRDLIRTSTITNKDRDALSAIVGRDLKKEPSKLMAVDDALQMATRGELSEAQVMDNILGILETPQADDLGRQHIGAFLSRKLQAENKLVQDLTALPPELAARRFAAHAASSAGREIKLGIAQERATMGTVGHILDGIDPIYTSIWRNGIERTFAGPLAKAVLTFMNLGPFNILENYGMMMSGQMNPFKKGANWGFMGADDFSEITRGIPVDPSYLRRGAREATPGPFGALGEVAKDEVHLPFLGETIGGKVTNPLVKWTDWMNERGSDMRRAFYANRLEARGGAVLQQLHRDPLFRNSAGALSELEGAVNGIPTEIPDKFRREAQRRFRIAVATGNPDNIRAVANQFTTGVAMKQEINAVVSKFNSLDMNSRALMRNIRGIDDIDANAAAAETSYRNGILKGPEYVDDALQGFHANLLTQPPKNQAEMSGVLTAYMARLQEVKSITTDIMDTAWTLKEKMGVKVTDAAFKESYERITKLREAFNRGNDQIVKTLQEQGRNLAIPMDDIVDAAREQGRIWSTYWEQEVIQHDLHFGSGGTAEEWFFMRRKRFKDMDVDLEKAKMSFITLASDFKARVALGPNYVAPDLEELTRRYLNLPNGVEGNSLMEGSVTKYRTEMEQLKGELRKTFMAPPLTGEEADALKRWGDDIVAKAGSAKAGTGQAERWSAEAQRAAAAAKADTDRAFINYKDQSTLDYLMKHVYPFWMYESRAWPRLTRIALQNPKALSTFGPGGTYWEHTDNGYVSLGDLPVQVSPVRGTIIGRLKRAFGRDIPEYEAGVYGEYLHFMDRLEKWGFYPGLHVNAPVNATLSMLSEDRSPRLGEFMPPAYEAALSTLVAGGAAAGLPPNAVSALQRVFSGDRFQDKAINVALFNDNIIPSQATPEQRRTAIAKISALQILESQLSLTRYRPEQYTAYQKLRDEAYGLIAGIPKEEMERLKDAGLSVYEAKPLDPFQRQELTKVLGDKKQDAYREINAPLRSMKDQQKLKSVADFWDNYDARREGDAARQIVEDTMLARGDLSPKEWRDRRRDRAQDRRTAFDASLKVLGLTEADMRSTLPQSTVDQAIRAYHGVDIKGFTGADGEVDWRGFYETQRRTLDDVDPITKAKATKWINERGSPVEQEYRAGYDKGYGDWFDKQAAQDWFIQRYGREELVRRAFASTEQADVSAQRLTATGASEAEVRRARRAGGRATVERVVELHRREMLQRNPDLAQWLRVYFGTVR